MNVVVDNDITESCFALIGNNNTILFLLLDTLPKLSHAVSILKLTGIILPENCEAKYMESKYLNVV